MNSDQKRKEAETEVWETWEEVTELPPGIHKAEKGNKWPCSDTSIEFLLIRELQNESIVSF